MSCDEDAQFDCQDVIEQGATNTFDQQDANEARGLSCFMNGKPRVSTLETVKRSYEYSTRHWTIWNEHIIHRRMIKNEICTERDDILNRMMSVAPIAICVHTVTSIGVMICSTVLSFNERTPLRIVISSSRSGSIELRWN